TSCAAAVDVQDGVVREVRLAFGSLAPRPWRAFAAEAHLTGRPATAGSFAAAADAELAAARPLPDNAFKAELARNLTVQLLTDLTEGAR
ncbi:xanthine dehydrogenase family protein subunit M, partial [Streptomyces sp. T-3]|nr:xanthine dehydrogenase family protein subunit M [Streptomyces sp. T-3]